MLGPKKKAKPPPPSPPKRSKFKPPRKRKGDHSDSDEDWTPWTETTQRSSNRGIKCDVFGFDSYSTQVKMEERYQFLKKRIIVIIWKGEGLDPFELVDPEEQ